jgi:hypothetical protein
VPTHEHDSRRYLDGSDRAANDLRPGGQLIAAQVLWRRGRRPPGAAYLYRVDAAKPKRTPSPAQLAALAKALAARRRCPECGTDAGYVLSGRLGACNPCAERSRWLASEAA